MILVSRNWTNDERLIERVLPELPISQRRLIRRREAFARIKYNRHKAWVVMYPEGTRRTDAKLLKVRYSLAFGLNSHAEGINAVSSVRQGEGQARAATSLVSSNERFRKYNQG